MIAAQSYQEPNLNQADCSSRGAMGIMRSLPATARDQAIAISEIEKSAERNIEAGKDLHQRPRHPHQKPDAVRFRRLQRRVENPERVPHQGERHGGSIKSSGSVMSRTPRPRSSIAKPFSM